MTTRTVMMAALLALPCSALTIEMREHAEVATSYVRLSDVASLPDATDDERSRLSALFLGRAPRDGAESEVRREDVLLELRKQGVQTDRVRFEGAQSTKVTRAEERGESPDRAFTSKLSRAVALFLRRQPAFAGAEVQVDVLGPVETPSGAGSVTEVAPDQTPAPGVGWWEATWKPDQQAGSARGAGNEARIAFQARVSAFLEVVVAKRQIAANASLTADDVDTARVGADAGREYFTVVADVLGQQVARPLAKGTPLEPASLKAVTLVKQRDVVLVTVEGPGFGIEFYAEAQENGALGDAIRAKNLTSDRMFVARVVGRGRLAPVGVGEGGNR